MASTQIQALGLGDIEVYSALNQPLVAEIELTSVRPGETDNMRVKLANEDAFIHAGVERPFYLTRLKFNLAVKPDGTQYVNVTTQGPVREPFLSFLIDVDWPRGRLVREYTVLLDPPVFVGARDTAPQQADSPPVSAAVTATGTPALIERDKTAPSTDDFGFEDEPVATPTVTPEQDLSFAEDSAQQQAERVADLKTDEFETIDTTDDAIYDDEGFGVVEEAEAEDLAAGLPDIKISAETEVAPASDFEEPATDSAISPEFEEAAPEDAVATEDAILPEFEEAVPDDVVATEFEETAAEVALLTDITEEYEAEESFMDSPAETAAADEALADVEYDYLEDAEQDLFAEEEQYLEDSGQLDYEDDLAAADVAYTQSALDTELPDIALFHDASLPYDEQATNALLAQFAAEDEVLTREEFAATSDEHEVVAGDTLYEIASKYKAPDVTVDQAMLSILRYNPDAFIRDNINSVKKGFVLRIPDRDSMLQIDSAQAMAEVRQQYALWREYRNQLVGAPSTMRDAQAADDLYIAESGVQSGQAEGGELSILSPGRDALSTDRASGAQEGFAEGSSLYVDLQLAREQLQAERLEREELQARLTELSTQIDTTDRIISINDEQLAQLQQRLREAATETVAEQPLPEEATADLTEPISQEDTEPALDIQLEQESPLPLATEDLVLAADETAAVIDEEQVAAAEEEELDAASLVTDELEPSVETDLALEPEIEQDLVAAAEEAAISDTELDAPSPAIDLEEDLAAEDQLPATIDSDAVPTQVPAATQIRQRYGLAAYAYEYLPSPWNVMAADFLETAYGVPVLGGTVALVLLLLYLAVRPKKVKKAKKAKKPEKIEEESLPAAEDTASVKEVAEATEDVHLTIEPAKPGLAERLSNMFAPLTAIFGGKKSSIASIAAAAPAAATAKDKAAEVTKPQEEEGVPDAVIEDLGEIESFEETAKTAAEEATTEIQAPVETTTGDETIVELPEVSDEAETSDDTTQEADVYLAYGLHDQAEELLTQALASNPGKTEYKGKLLETYYAAGKKTEYESLAAELHTDLGGRSSRVWDKAVAMGKEIAPDNSLFADADAAGLKVSDFAPAKPATTDLDLGEASGTTTPDIALDEGDESAATSTDFDLDLGEGDDDSDSTILVTPDNEDRTEILSSVDIDAEEDAHDETDLQFDLDADSDDFGSDLEIDFNADELGLGTDSADETPAATNLDVDAEEENEDATIAMDVAFDIDDEQAETSDASADAAIELDLGDSEDINLDDLDNVDEDVFEADSTASDDLLADLDLGSDEIEESAVETEFEIPESAESTIIDADLDDETISGDVGDEVSTKLDLAKAYMDMGDYDGASSTLEEVVVEGDAGQRKEAEELLQQIH